MNLRSLQTFVSVMEEGTLARAAARMNLSQSAASRLLRILEDEFGVHLFHRDKKRLKPTSEGEVFYPEAVRILASIRDIPDFFIQAKSNASPPLRIICHPRIVNGLVLPAMAMLARSRPGLRMKLEIYPRRDLGRRIMNDRFDIGVSTLPLPVETLAPTVLGSSDLHIVLPKNHRLAGREAIRPEDVADENYIALDETTVIRRIVDQALAAAGKRLTVMHEVSAGAAAYRLVQGGLGFTFADPIALDPELADRVEMVPWQPTTSVQFGYFLSDASRLRDGAELFGRALRQIFHERLDRFG